ncbi:MAG: ThuA domain-containing protein [Bacteroidota bacterium]|nr:ThuA domain-containing protein [Bacteroidota bacterium]
MDHRFIPGVFINRYWYVIFFACSVIMIECKASSSSAKKNEVKSLRVLMVGGGSSHDFDKWYRQTDAKTLERDGLATVRYISDTDSILYYLPNMDVLYLSNNQPINNQQVRQAIFNHVNSGKGLILSHAALWYNWKDWPEYNMQLAGGGSGEHDAYGTFEVVVVNRNHPVMQNVAGTFILKDELYHYIAAPAGPGIEVLANAVAKDSDKTYPSVFVVKHPKARIVGIALGHDSESHNIIPYQILLRNAVKWCAKM